MNVSPIPEPTEAQPDPNVESQDELGALEGHSQQPDEDAVVDQGAQSPAQIKTASKATLGRHVKHEEGKASAKRRSQHVQSTRKAREAENWSK